MSTLSVAAPHHGHPVRFRLMVVIGAILLLSATAAEAIAGTGCAHHGAAGESAMSALHDAGAETDHGRFPGEHRACTCIGDCLAPTAILPPDAVTEPASWPAESRTTLIPAPALDLHGCAPYTLPYSQAPPLAG